MKPVLMLLAGLFASAVRLRAVKAVSGAFRAQAGKGR